MFPVRLIYASTLSERCGPDDVQDILEASRAFNRANDITGLLFFNADYFLQCLEGKRQAVNELYNTIQGDSRHTRVILLDYEGTSTRMFADWSMAYLAGTHVDPDILAKYFPDGRFNPYLLDSETAHALTWDLSRQLGKADLF
ncbi:MAG: BLUF domain-containing protein [Lentisphaeria bacterium]|nr:BLUF domain-containing protein [Lentisphaeria bacterium]